MLRIRLALVLALTFAIVPATAGAEVEVTTTPVAFEVVNPQDPLTTWTVRGHLHAPEGQACSGVMLLLHGLSYGQWGWDFPLEPDTYSVTRALVKRGIASVAIDELGYDTSGGDADPDGRRANGYTLTVQSYAAMTAQIVDQLRESPFGFSTVGLMGHSAGTEISELTAGIFGNADLLVATAYHHSPTQRIVTDFVTGDVVRAAQDDYEYFGENEAQRAEYMFNLDVADEDVVAKDTELANPTPSGEVWSISNQPSRWVLPAIDVPVLLVVAEEDILFQPADDPVAGQDNVANELALFVGTDDKSAYVIPEAGHSFMLHPNAPETNGVIADWISERMDLCA